MTIEIEPATAPGVAELLRLSDEYALSLYPADSCYMLDVGELLARAVTVVVARDGTEAVGMGALVERGDGTAELKRMFVRADHRSRGLASGILTALEERAIERAVALMQLETGPLQLEAIALYERRGYRVIPNFGQYVGDEFSLCIQKRLD
jgi:putative acetyltransferase